RYRYVVDDTGLTLTASASVGYVAGYSAFIVGDNGPERGVFTSGRADGENINGFQHYQFGLVADYSLNKLFNVSNRYGEFSVRGQLYYTDGISDNTAATTQLWGGVGIQLAY
ncbi:MAG TPA: hypothetical protein VF595_17075, partial [Tepidisphaeraceae bacterium]